MKHPKRPAFSILYVDENEHSLKHFQRLLEPYFHILVATNARDASLTFKAHKQHIAIVVSDFNLAQNKGIEMLGKMKGQKPEALYLVSLRYSELEYTLESFDKDGLYHYLHKPWEGTNLLLCIQRAMEFFLVNHQHRILKEKYWSHLQQTFLTERILSLHLLAAEVSHLYQDTLEAVQSFIGMNHPDEKPAPETLPTFQAKQSLHHLFSRLSTQSQNLSDLLCIGYDQGKKPTSRDGWKSCSLRALIQTAIDAFQRTFSERKHRISLDLDIKQDSILSIPVHLEQLIRLLFQAIPFFVSQGALIRIRIEKVEHAAGSALYILIKARSDCKPSDGTRALLHPFDSCSEANQQFGLHLLAMCIVSHHLQGGVKSIDEARGQGESLAIVLPCKPRKNRPRKTTAMDWRRHMAKGTLTQIIASMTGDQTLHS